MPTICVVYFDAGGGHRNACEAVGQILSRERSEWRVVPLNLQELLDPLDIFLKVSGVRTQDYYNLILKRGWTLGAAHMLKVVHGIIRLLHPKIVRALAAYFERQKPGLVLSVIPNFNRALAESIAAAIPGTPFATLITDFADYPPNFWIERESQYVICGTERAVAQAIALGHARENIFRTSGMVLKPAFYEHGAVDAAPGRRQLGLDPDVLTGVVLFGGQGSRAMYDIAMKLDALDVALQLILICGRNQPLAERLRTAKTRKKMFVEGFTTDVPRYLGLSDFLIGKPGPGTISEAVAFHLPVIVECNAWTLPQERYNARWLEERQLGIVVPSFRQIEKAVLPLTSPEVLDSYKANAAGIDNRAIFEIPAILSAILQRSGDSAYAVRDSRGSTSSGIASAATESMGNLRNDTPHSPIAT